jgi:predicted DNA-binding transcriptional regulator YafY
MAKKQSRTDAERRVRQCERLGRLLQTLHLIMGKGRWDADGLAQELECSRRTVYRLLQTLSMAGVPWFFDESCRAYRVRPGYKFTQLMISPNPQLESTRSAGELIPAVQRLIADGEAFTRSLKEFQAIIESASQDRKAPEFDE